LHILALTTQQLVQQTDASPIAVGAILEQDGHVIAYASHSLTFSEHNCNVIQCEFLAIVLHLSYFDTISWDDHFRYKLIMLPYSDFQHKSYCPMWDSMDHPMDSYVSTHPAQS